MFLDISSYIILAAEIPHERHIDIMVIKKKTKGWIVVNQCFGHSSGIMLRMIWIVNIENVMTNIRIYPYQVTNLIKIFHTYLCIIQTITCMVILHTWSYKYSLNVLLNKSCNNMIGIILI